MKITIIDYGMGNIKSISSALRYLGIQDIIISSKYEDIKSADKLILPGVGSFARAMTNIKKLNIDTALGEIVIKDKKPILGICLGMQLLCKSSEEDSGAEGLNYIDAVCTKFNTTDLKVPHVGFNQITINEKSNLLKNIKDVSDFYFTHSYKVTSNSDITQSYCTYGEDFIAAYENNNILGTQFHPELSQTNGLTLLKNFIEKF
jgi:glutamine amidotransferase